MKRIAGEVCSYHDLNGFETELTANSIEIYFVFLNLKIICNLTVSVIPFEGCEGLKI